jgi:hypothetical protein
MFWLQENLILMKKMSKKCSTDHRFILKRNNTAGTITKSNVPDKICSEVLLKCLNEAVACTTAVTVWKAKTFMDPLGQRIFQEKSNLQCTRSVTTHNTTKDIGLPVPGYPALSTNIMARIWNTVPDSNMHLLWGLPNHLQRSGQKISPDSSLI